MMKKNNWGGSAAAGGMNFQAAATAIAMTHMSRETPLQWLTGIVDDTPVAVRAETGNAGDDIQLLLKDGSVVEVQVKKSISGSQKLWDTLLAFSEALRQGEIAYGVLVVGPNTSPAVRDQLARDIIRLGQGRDDDLKAIGTTLKTKLLDRGLDVAAVCSRLRIVTVHALDSDAASVNAARAELAHITDIPGLAWDATYHDAGKLIEYRGRRTAATTLQMLASVGVQLRGAVYASLVAYERFLTDRLAASATFSIPGLPFPVSIDKGWIPLKIRRIDQEPQSDADLESALRRYREWGVRGGHGGERQYDAQTAGWFFFSCVIVAGPGMGKSTLLKRLVRAYAADGQIALVARLAAIARRMERGFTFEESLFEVSLDATGIKKSDLEAHGIGQFTFLLDGLDECGNMQDALAESLATFARTHSAARFVLTTRPVGYDTVHLSAWTHYELVPLKPDDAVRHVETVLCGVQFADPAATVSNALSFARREIGRGASKMVVDSPLMVSMLSALAVRGLSLGATRADLYEQLVKLLESAPDTRIDRGGPSVPILRRFIALLGWASIRLPAGTSELLLDECAHALSHELGKPPLAARDICETCLQWWEAMGMLERIRFRGEESVSFTHKTFGEYCAALCLTSMQEEIQEDFLCQSEAASAWRETIDFACALGLAPLAVNVSLRMERRGRMEADAIVRALRRTSCSAYPLDEALASQLIAMSLKWISSVNARMAAQVAEAFVAAAPKLPGIESAVQPFLSHAKGLTRVAAQGCVLACQPDRLATGELAKIAMGCAAEARGEDWRLWQKTLLLAVKELVRRKAEPQAKVVLEELRRPGNVSVATFFELAELLAGAGIDMQHPELDATTRLFSAGFAENAIGAKVLLQTLIDCGSEVDPGLIREDAPPMHLSALVSAADLWGMPAGQLAAWADPSYSKDAGPILQAFAGCVGVNLGRMRTEAQARLTALHTDGQLGSAWEGIVDVDVLMQPRASRIAPTPKLLKAGLMHPSDWIVSLSTKLILWSCDAAGRRSYADFAFAGSGTTLWAACELASSLEPEAAIALIFSNSKGSVRKGQHFLFDKLASLHVDLPFDFPVLEVESNLLSQNADVARSVARLLLSIHHSDVPSLVNLVDRALSHWTKVERPYPTSFGFVPASPRPDLIKILIANQGITADAALQLAGDARPDVREVALNFLLGQAKVQEDLVTTIITETRNGRLDTAILHFLLEKYVVLTSEQTSSLVETLRHAPRAVRLASLPILHGPYLSVEDRRSLARELSMDSDMEIQQSAHDLLDEL